MKAAVLHCHDETLSAKEFVTFEDVIDPRFENPTDVIVRFGGAGVCRTDLHIVEGTCREKPGETNILFDQENAID